MNHPCSLPARCLTGFLATLFTLGLAGCNHANVTPIQGTTTQVPAGLSSGGLPPTIYVAPFATEAAHVQVDPGGPLTRLSNGQPILQHQRGSLLGGLFNPQNTQENPYQTTNQVSSAELQAATDLQKGIVKALQDKKIPATSAGYYQDGMTNSLLLTGQFLTIDQGSKSKRIVIGLGVGAANLEAQAQLRDLDEPQNPPLLMFHTQADTGSSPGILVGGVAGAAVTGTAAIGAGVSGYRQSQSGTGSISESTADGIADYIEKFYQQQGWLPPSTSSNTTTVPNSSPSGQ
jgi:hypothetical protein